MKSRDIINAVLADRNICADDFYSRFRDPHFVAARMDCARRLRDAGYEYAAIGRFMKRNPTTILYYLNEDMRARKKDYYSARGALKYLPDHIRAIVSEYAKAKNTTPRAIVSDWISDRAKYEARAREAA